MEIIKMLDKWVEPSKLFSAVEKDGDNMSMLEAVNGAKKKEWRECWMATNFGIGYKNNVEPCKVLVLSKTDFPDFKVKIKTSLEQDCESVMIMEPGRRLADEYKEIERILKKKGKHFKVINRKAMLENEKKVPCLVKDIIASKNAHYPRDVVTSTNLCIYVNINVTSLDMHTIRTICKEYINTFASVWLISGKYIGTLFISKRSILTQIDGFTEIHKL